MKFPALADRKKVVLMADRQLQSPLAPVIVPPERMNTVFEVKLAPDAPGGRGPLRFEEGIATDTAVPNDFGQGMSDGYSTGARPNQNAVVWIKPAEQVMGERAHLGSAAWPEAPTYTQSFAEGAGPEAEVRYIGVERDGAHYQRRNAACVID